MFLLTSMPVGGAETLLANLVRKMSDRFQPLICCLKQLGELGETLRDEFPTFSELIDHKYDVKVIGRLKQLFLEQQVDAVVTVGAGDKMFWGRIAANRARVPVVLSALHSTGWPDGIGKLNRMLTSITDRFIAVAKNHGQFLVDFEKFPADKVAVIPNGIDVDRFDRSHYDRQKTRDELGLAADDPVVGIIAALRAEKNHLLFLQAAANVRKACPNARFLVVGDGPERPMLESAVQDLDLKQHVILAGSRSDVPELLNAIDVFGLTSKNEASPVSIMEALAMQVPVVAPDVGSISETVLHEKTGFLFQDGDAGKIAEYWLRLIRDPQLASTLGKAGRDLVCRQSSLDSMVAGYEKLIAEVYTSKVGAPADSQNRQANRNKDPRGSDTRIIL